MIMVLASPMWSQYRRKSALEEGDHYHFAYVSGMVGYSTLTMHGKGVMPHGGAGGGVGFGYEYRNSGLWASVGLQMSFHRSQIERDPYSTYTHNTNPDYDPFKDAKYEGYRGLDTQGKSTLFIYDVQQRDQIEWNFLDIPVMIGYYTHGFHIGGGLKVSYALSSKTHTKGQYELKGMNEDYYNAVSPVIFQNVPEAGYTTYPIQKNTQENRLNVGASLIGEIGYDLLSSAPFRSRVCHVLKLSFYFEYGLNNIAKGNEQGKRSVEINPLDVREAKINSYLNTVDSPGRIVPFFAGVKMTYMIGGSRTARSGFHHGCMCYN
jgi:hypothetical protein